METGPRFKVSSERPEKQETDLAIPGLVVVQPVIHYTTAASDLHLNDSKIYVVTFTSWKESNSLN